MTSNTTENHRQRYCQTSIKIMPYRSDINPLKMKRRPLYWKTQFVPSS